jgi:hypothetical protein
MAGLMLVFLITLYANIMEILYLSYLEVGSILDIILSLKGGTSCLSLTVVNLPSSE